MNPDQRNWELSKYPINDSGMMKNTFESMFKLINKPDSVIGMYNDEIPNVHLLSTTRTLDFWVIHSIPKLSYSNTSYVYPKTGRIYGQHFLCLTLEKKYIDFIITQFTLARPLFQSAYISPSVKLKFPDLAKLLENTKVPTESQNNVVELQTANKALQLKHFSKSSDFGKDLYADFVAPTLKKSLDTETWQHDGSLPSACHRQYSPHQFYRGGGTMCIMNQQLWQSFYTTIQSVEECGKIIAIVKYLFKQLSFVIEIVQYVFIMYA
ncbi:Cell death-related nuclease 6 [Schistosoma japonicum]|nr:Cell death-related nuclease 6 [Schistosoma japonicum]